MSAAGDYEISAAKPSDVAEIVALQRDNLIMNGGSLSVEFLASWFERVLSEMPIMVARRNSRLVGYIVASTRDHTRDQSLIEAKFRAYPTAPTDSYNSGPLCVAHRERGHGLALLLMNAQRRALPGREAIAFIRQDNAASRVVHEKAGYREVAEFVHDRISYFTVARAG